MKGWHREQFFEQQNSAQYLTVQFLSLDSLYTDPITSDLTRPDSFIFQQ
jgi:hypothetical protein